MKKFIAIFLLSTYLISAIELNQLLKLPLLVEHYREHTEKNRKLSLFHFLFVHYVGADLKDADEKEDNKLPFKSHDGCVNIAAMDYVPTNFHKLILKTPMPEKKSYPAHPDQFLSSQFLSSVWQPPKSC